MTFSLSKFTMGIFVLYTLVTFAFAFLHVDGLSEKVALRKRLGKSSFIHRQKHDTLPKLVASPDELTELANKSAIRQRGSSKYRKSWKHWLELAIGSIRQDLSTRLPHPTEINELAKLTYDLGVAADRGEMPSFSNPGARSGYALDFFCRARLLADFLVDIGNESLPPFWTNDVIPHNPALFGTRTPCDGNKDSSVHLTSIGGGPGYDFVAAALAATFTSSAVDVPEIRGLILDYEEGWGDLVDAMNTATRCALQQPRMSCEWGGKCDITKPLAHEDNIACLAAVETTQIWTCQYCVAENAKQLRESDYIFFQDLFHAIPEGSIVIITETTPRLWPEFFQVINHHCSFMQVGFPNKRGPQLVLRKSTKTGASLRSEDEELLRNFEDISEQHENRLRSGWERQTMKVRNWLN